MSVLEMFAKIVRVSCIKSKPSNLYSSKVFFRTEPDIAEIFQAKEPETEGKKYIPDVPEITEKEHFKPRAKDKDIIITCERPEFNHYRNQKYDKFKTVPLASKGWFHNKSVGDHFSIRIYDESYDVSDWYWGEGLPNFDELEIDGTLKQAIKNVGLMKPTRIQWECLPVVLSGSNTLIAAETGCGKTLAFLVPILQQILRWKGEEGVEAREANSPLALVLTPSRELAVQTANIARELCNHLPISCHVLTGGRTKQKMLNPEFRNVDLQIATLGAMSKLTTTGIYNVKEVKHLVIDESDTMLDDSFSEHLLRYLKKFKIQLKPSRRGEPTGCQLTLVSATYPGNFEETLVDFAQPESFKKVTSKNLHRFLPHVPQTFHRLNMTQKPGKLLSIAREAVSKKQPTMIFSNKAPTCDWIAMMLHENGLEALNLNGEMPLSVRMGKFEQFQAGEIKVLSCTDIASRGLDTKHVQHVVNYDFPLYMADYIHRCGRTGRCGSSNNCQVTNFVSGMREIELVNKIELAVRTMEALPNVNGNITKIIRKRIMQSNVT